MKGCIIQNPLAQCLILDNRVFWPDWCVKVKLTLIAIYMYKGRNRKRVNRNRMFLSMGYTYLSTYVSIGFFYISEELSDSTRYLHVPFIIGYLPKLSDGTSETDYSSKCLLFYIRCTLQYYRNIVGSGRYYQNNKNHYTNGKSIHT